MLAPTAMAVFEKRTMLPDVRFGRASGNIVGFNGARNRTGASTIPVFKNYDDDDGAVAVSAFCKTTPATPPGDFVRLPPAARTRATTPLRVLASVPGASDGQKR